MCMGANTGPIIFGGRFMNTIEGRSDVPPGWDYNPSAWSVAGDIPLVSELPDGGRSKRGCQWNHDRRARVRSGCLAPPIRWRRVVALA